MKKSNIIISSCKFCHHYQSEGRRGGNCTQLGVAVNSSWKSCRLAIPSFVSDWDNVQEVVNLSPSIYLDSGGNLQHPHIEENPVMAKSIEDKEENKNKSLALNSENSQYLLASSATVVP